MAAKVFPTWKLGEKDGLANALRGVPGAVITVLDLGDVVLDKRAQEAIGGEPLEWIQEVLSKVAGGIGRFVIPTEEEEAAGMREEEELKRVAAEGNPWLKGTTQWNITRQIELEKSQPELAAKLKKQAEAELALYANALERKRREDAALMRRGRR